jgi:non-ribosomal peptide synthetase component E (peptide arylation enzyme)
LPLSIAQEVSGPPGTLASDAEISGGPISLHTAIGPDPGECCGLIEREEINSMFAPPTVWISFLRHKAFEEHDLASFQKVQYGASIMPVSVLPNCSRGCPTPASTTATGRARFHL